VLASMGRFGGIFSSDLSRAVQTAAILKDALGTALPLEVEPGLREYDVGGWSGRTREEIESRWPGDIRRFACGELAAPPGGETRAGFDSRILAAAERVAERASSAGADGVLVVAHGGVVMGLARLAGVVEYRVGNLAGYTGRCDAGALFPEEPIDLLELELAAD
jgi:broad specificity phosphatase PhoE